MRTKRRAAEMTGDALRCRIFAAVASFMTLKDERIVQLRRDAAKFLHCRA